MKEIILSIDPGDTTGYVLARVSEKEVKIIEKGEATFPDGVRAILRRGHNSDKVVIEDFTIRIPLIGSKGIAMRVLGGVQLEFPGKVVLQQPSEKLRCPDAMLKKLDLWNPSKHIRDAARHAVIYAQKRFKFTS